MPRESVTPDQHMVQQIEKGTGEPIGEPHLHRMPTVEVGWARDTMSVQVGLETPDHQSGQYHLVDHLYGSEETREAIAVAFEQLITQAGRRVVPIDGHEMATVPLDPATVGRLLLDAVVGANANVGHGGDRAHTGWYTHLTREGCNRLITVVRKARDSAFGKDA